MRISTEPAPPVPIAELAGSRVALEAVMPVVAGAIATLQRSVAGAVDDLGDVDVWEFDRRFGAHACVPEVAELRDRMRDLATLLAAADECPSGDPTVTLVGADR